DHLLRDGTCECGAAVYMKNGRYFVEEFDSAGKSYLHEMPRFSGGDKHLVMGHTRVVHPIDNNDDSGKQILSSRRQEIILEGSGTPPKSELHAAVRQHPVVGGVRSPK